MDFFFFFFFPTLGGKKGQQLNFRKEKAQLKNFCVFVEKEIC